MHRVVGLGLAISIAYCCHFGSRHLAAAFALLLPPAQGPEAVPSADWRWLQRPTAAGSL